MSTAFHPGNGRGVTREKIQVQTVWGNLSQGSLEQSRKEVYCLEMC